MLAWIILSRVGGCPVHRRVLGILSSLCPLEAGGPLHTPQRTLYVCACCHCSRVWLFATLLTEARLVPLSMGFSRQEYWSGLPCSPPGDLSDPRIEPVSHVSCIGRHVLYHLRHLGRPSTLTKRGFQMWPNLPGGQIPAGWETLL